MAELERNKRSLGEIKLIKNDSNIFKSYHQDNYYNRWIRAENPNPITLTDSLPSILQRGKYSPVQDLSPWVIFPYPGSDGFNFLTAWMDPLVKHLLKFDCYIPYDKQHDPYYFVNYVNRSFKPTLSFIYSVYDWYGGIWKDELFYQNVNNISLTARFPINFIDSPFQRLSVGTGLNYQKVDKKAQELKTKPIFEDGEALTFEAFTRFTYNLPYLNSYYHPVRKFQIAYNLSAANAKFGMLQSFYDHNLQLDLGFAPFYDVWNLKIDRLTYKNQTTLELLNGDYLAQYRPGLDSWENLPFGGEIIADRRYLRGIEQTLTGEKMLITKNEVWAKICDDTGLKLVIKQPLLEFKYTGIGGWFDYGKLWKNNVEKNFKTMGWEIKTVLEICQLPIVYRFGNAHDMNGNYLGLYHQINIPLSRYLDY